LRADALKEERRKAGGKEGRKRGKRKEGKKDGRTPMRLLAMFTFLFLGQSN
jgi:hypothetical protein